MAAAIRPRLLCAAPECRALREVTAIKDSSALLVCGHSRTVGLLPLSEGRLSIEHLKPLSADGNLAFPRDKDADSLDRWRLN
jgi:hypothetical protein